MRVVKLKIENFRGIKKCDIIFQGHTVLVGDNNTGKSTILEAIDLVLGPERLSHYPVIDEHDFYAGKYIGDDVRILIEVVIIDLSDEQQRHFRNHIEWWNTNNNSLIEEPPPESTDEQGVVSALRLGFNGNYDAEEDDFTGNTFFLSPQKDDETYDWFGKKDKRLCGFLFLRTLRTGSRALSLERGSLLDIILRLRELRPQMWEDVLSRLRNLSVADNPDLGITDILTSVQDAVRSFVPSDWAENPHMRVSNLTRAHLRRVLTVFMGTGSISDDGTETEYAAPFQHQGTGTINMLVLALLSIIAELRQNVIFAMEEPEIAIPPHTQKHIINSVISKSAQAIFTSHSPYVLQEFKPSQILVIKREDGELSGVPAKYPPAVKPKRYREEFRRRFCEALLSRRVLITEGRTEYDTFPAAARRLHELHSNEFKPLEALGIAIVNAETDSQVGPLGNFYQALGKIVFAIFDQQTHAGKSEIEAVVDYPYEAPERGFENVILNNTDESALRRYANSLVSNNEWPTHLSARTPSNSMPLEDLKDALKDYLIWAKGAGSIADLLGQCNKDEMPEFVVETIESIQSIVETIESIQSIVETESNSENEGDSNNEQADSSENSGQTELNSEQE